MSKTKVDKYARISLFRPVSLAGLFGLLASSALATPHYVVSSAARVPVATASSAAQPRVRVSWQRDDFKQRVRKAEKSFIKDVRRDDVAGAKKALKKQKRVLEELNVPNDGYALFRHAEKRHRAAELALAIAQWMPTTSAGQRKADKKRITRFLKNASKKEAAHWRPIYDRLFAEAEKVLSQSVANIEELETTIAGNDTVQIVKVQFKGGPDALKWTIKNPRAYGVSIVPVRGEYEKVELKFSRCHASGAEKFLCRVETSSGIRARWVKMNEAYHYTEMVRYVSGPAGTYFFAVTTTGDKHRDKAYWAGNVPEGPLSLPQRDIRRYMFSTSQRSWWGKPFYARDLFTNVPAQLLVFAKTTVDAKPHSHIKRKGFEIPRIQSKVKKGEPLLHMGGIIYLRTNGELIRFPKADSSTGKRARAMKYAGSGDQLYAEEELLTLERPKKLVFPPLYPDTMQKIPPHKDDEFGDLDNLPDDIRDSKDVTKFNARKEKPLACARRELQKEDPDGKYSKGWLVDTYKNGKLVKTESMKEKIWRRVAKRCKVTQVMRARKKLRKKLRKKAMAEIKASLKARLLLAQ